MRDGAARREPDHERAEDAHGAERHDEGLDASEGDDEAVGQAAGGAQRDGREHADAQACPGRAPPRLFRVRIMTPATQRRHGADRQIEPAAGDHEGGADRDDGDEGRARHHVEQVRAVRKSGLISAPAMMSTISAMKGESARMSMVKRRFSAPVRSTVSVMRGPRRSPPPFLHERLWRDRRWHPRTGRACATSPAMRPLRMTTTRWHSPISSCISEEMTTTARPSAASAAMKR